MIANFIYKKKMKWNLVLSIKIWFTIKLLGFQLTETHKHMINVNLK